MDSFILSTNETLSNLEVLGDLIIWGLAKKPPMGTLSSNVDEPIKANAHIFSRIQKCLVKLDPLCHLLIPKHGTGPQVRILPYGGCTSSPEVQRHCFLRATSESGT